MSNIKSLKINVVYCDIAITILYYFSCVTVYVFCIEFLFYFCVKFNLIQIWLNGIEFVFIQIFPNQICHKKRIVFQEMSFLTYRCESGILLTFNRVRNAAIFSTFYIFFSLGNVHKWRPILGLVGVQISDVTM